MNRIDELSLTRTTAQVIACYRNKHGKDCMDELQEDLKGCSTGNRLAIIEALEHVYKPLQYLEREDMTDKDVVEALHETE